MANYEDELSMIKEQIASISERFIQDENFCYSNTKILQLIYCEGSCSLKRTNDYISCSSCMEVFCHSISDSSKKDTKVVKEKILKEKKSSKNPDKDKDKLISMDGHKISETSTSKSIYTSSNFKAINADSRKFLKGIRNESFDCIHTDPPYGMSYQSNASKKRKHEIIKNDSVDLRLLLGEMIFDFYRVLKNDRFCIIYTGKGGLDVVKSMMKEAGFSNVRELIWVKSIGLGNLSEELEAIEYIVIGEKGNPKLMRRINKYVTGFNVSRKMSEYHQTPKPSRLSAYILSAYTEPGYLILDAFAGTASSIFAMRDLGLSGVFIELDEGYYNNIESMIKSVKSFTDEVHYKKYIESLNRKDISGQTKLF